MNVRGANVENPVGRNAVQPVAEQPATAGERGEGVESAAGVAEGGKGRSCSQPWGAWICLSLAMSIAGSAVVAGKLLVGRLPVFLAAELGLGVGLLVMAAQEPVVFVLAHGHEMAQEKSE